MRIKVEYTDESIEHYDSIYAVEAGIKETKASRGSDCRVHKVTVVDDNDGEVAEMLCTWRLSVRPKSLDHPTYSFCMRCTTVLEGERSLCDGCKAIWDSRPGKSKMTFGEAK